ncbi:helix-turn-helix transcriptional regulator [Oscillatoria sp. FACHB-1407]|nr:helix-turn-helix transcriptional regulator [Oscillatoria sp. FACHB-1407]
MEHQSLPPIYGRRLISDRVLIELCPKQPYSVRYRPDWHILGFALEGQTGHDSFDSDRVQEYHAHPNTFAFTPAGCETFSESKQGGDYLVFAVSPEFFALYLQDVAPHQSITLHRQSNLRDPHVTAIARAAQTLIASNPTEGHGRLYAETLAGQFAVHTIFALSSRSTAPKTHQLTSHQIQQIVDFIDVNLCEDLSLATLADVIGMTQFHFARSFKVAVGHSPHAFVMERRLLRAKELLTQTTLPISHIALDCGFNSQSHLTRYFSQAFSISPNRFRQTVQG